MPQLSSDDILYRVVDQQSMGGKPVINIYWYCLQNPIIEPSLGDIGAAFNAQVAGLLDNEQSDQLTHATVLIERFALGDTEEFFLISGTGAAANNAVPCSRFNAVGVVLNVGTRETRPGSKRIAGLVEEDTDGEQLGVTAQASWLTATAGMADELAITIGDNPFPVVVRNTETVDGVTTPLNLGDWQWQRVTGRTLLVNVRSQVSRRSAAQ